MTTVSASQWPETRQIGGCTAQLPPESPPRQPKAAPLLPEGHRRIPLKPGVPIASQLEPGDRVVEVVTGGRPFVDGSDNAAEEIEAITRRAAAIAVVRVTGKESQLSAGGDWVDSTVTADVQSVLKDETGLLAEGGTTSFPEFGGEITLDGRRVIVHAPYRRQMAVGRTYLVPFVLRDGSLRTMSATATFELDGQTMRRQRADAEHHGWALDAKPADWAIQRVRAKAHLPRLMR